MALDYASTATRGRRARVRRAEAQAVSFVAQLDWLLMAAVGGLVGVGLWGIAGITRLDVPGDPDYHLVRQSIFVGLGGVLLIAGTLVDPAWYRRFWQPIFGGTVLLIAFVLLKAESVRGSARWIDFGFFQFQPSEIGKLTFLLGVAAFLADRWKRVGESRTVLGAIGLAAIPGGLVFLQPDLGTALVYSASLSAALFVAGIRWRHLVALLALLTLIAASVLWFLPSAGFEVLKPYQSARLTSFADPSNADPDARYNVDQSITAIGAGGVSGRGVTGATQTKYDYLPEHATDFVFASFAEQRGFVGCAALLLLYLLLIWRALRIVSVARDAYAAVVAGGLAFGLLFQIFINVGMTMGVAPVTGIPLPFVSVGGSAMISNLAMIGVLQGICVRGRLAGRR
jgi:rod shape determining protein RodA